MNTLDTMIDYSIRLFKRGKKFENALREVHEFNCGCDQPGEHAICTAQPRSAFTILK